MIRNISILLISAAVVALPFIFRREEALSNWDPGDPVLVVISPHNEAIRYEFGQAFSKWHEARYGQPVKVDWRVIGGTTEIMRYLAAEYVVSFRAWWSSRDRAWPVGGGEMILDRKFKPDAIPDAVAEDAAARRAWELKRDLHRAFRETDDPSAFSCKIDVFFGGGEYDHNKAGRQGLTVAPWPAGDMPTGLVATADGRVLIPEMLSGETWRGRTFFGTALSTFGICYNVDRLNDLGLPAPTRWQDLTAPSYAGNLGVADPTKSGSIAKAFEMIIQEQCRLAVRAAGYTEPQVDAYEQQIRAARLAPGVMPDGVPAAYQQAVERGWLNGLRLVQRIGANARYFTDSAGKVPIDVGMGNAAAGVAIDFYGRYQAETSRAVDGRERMVYVTPRGGSSVSADPISLLRGAVHRELGERFIEFVLSGDGQRLWNYRPGTPGGPARFALRRLPIRRDFYPAESSADATTDHDKHAPWLSDVLGDPGVNPYALAQQFVYRSRWTGRHFSIQRDLIRAMCLDSGDELRGAWRAILKNGGPAANARALELLARMPTRPEALTWSGALSVSRRHARLDYMREWTLFFRQSYAEAKRAAEAGGDDA